MISPSICRTCVSVCFRLLLRRALLPARLCTCDYCSAVLCSLLLRRTPGRACILSATLLQAGLYAAASKMAARVAASASEDCARAAATLQVAVLYEQGDLAGVWV